MLAYYGTEISPNQTETAEGYLICRNVPIARTGRMDYAAGELQLDGDPDRIVTVDRYPEDVFEAATLASFEGKPVTDGHPLENVGPENHAAYARGHVQNVRREGDFILADLYINDAGLASDVRNGVKREVSCGYLCTYTPDGSNYKQTHIRGNHVAVVPRGRAGHEVAIKDAAETAEKGRNYMSEFWKSILTAFGRAAKDASPEELDTMVTTTATVLDAAPAEAQEAEPTDDGAVQEAPQGGDLGGKLDRVIEMLSSLEKKGLDSAEEHSQNGKEDLDGLIERLADKDSPSKDEAVTIPADEIACGPGLSRDSTVALLKKVRPAVAAIKDKTERARVTDALVSALQDSDMMGSIMRAAQDNAKRAVDAATKTDYERICADQKAAYDARNPHKNQKEVSTWQD